jgi:hypothetical protein
LKFLAISKGIFVSSLKKLIFIIFVPLSAFCSPNNPSGKHQDVLNHYFFIEQKVMKQGPASLGSSRKIGQNDFAKIPGYLGGRFEEPINNTDIRFFLLKFSLESDVQATKEKLLAIFKTNSHVITLREMLNLVPGDLKHSLDRLAAISLIHQNGLGPNSQKQFETVEELNAAMTEYFLLLYPIQLPKLEDGFALVKGIQSTFEIPEHLQNKELKELRKYLQGMNSNEACILSTQFLSRIGVALGLAKSLNLANHQELLPFILSMRQMVSPIIKSTAILVRENVKHLHPAGPQNGELILMSLGQFGLGDGLGLHINILVDWLYCWDTSNQVCS